MRLTNKAYDILSFIQKTVLPGLGAFVFAIFEIWHGDMVLAAEITGTIAALDTFLGLLLGISTAQYTAEMKND